MLKITAEEVNFVIYQYLHESGTFLAAIFNESYRILALSFCVRIGGEYA
jgi:hypothetical protein